MTAKRTVCYYVTGHGYGHAIRIIQVLKALPPDVRVIVKTTVPERLFTEELPGRVVEIISAEFDCGAVQSDSLTVLPRETLARYREIAQRNEAHLPDEVGFLQREHVGAVVSDVPPFPLRAAREAGVPGVVVTNFTWADIYREYVEDDRDRQMLQEMCGEYAMATLALVTPLSLPTVAGPFTHVEHVPLIARQGESLRPALEKSLDRPVGTHFALLYLGVWGMSVDWSVLAQFTDWVFLTYQAPPLPVTNVVTLDRGKWPYARVMASVDAVVSKPGYGTVTECIANAIPFIYVPRKDFAEQTALVEGMVPWGGGVAISEADFHSGNWGRVLQDALECQLNPHAYATDGAQVVAERVLSLIV